MVHIIAIVIICDFFRLNKGIVECRMQGFVLFLWEEVSANGLTDGVC